MMLLTNDTRPPKPAETLGQYLHEMGIEHFTAPELLRMRRAAIDVPEPPRDWWPRMIPTLRAAEWVRHRMDHPIIVGNGYRPEPFNSRVGGARRSQHLYFRALDLDLPLRHRSQDNQGKFYEVAAELFLSHGAYLKMGLGIYRPWKGTRVHIDTGYKQRHWTKKYSRPLLDSLR